MDAAPNDPSAGDVGPGVRMSPRLLVAEGAGLRERKKVRTREALIAAAAGLFAQQGFEATTVDQIAAAVDVSQRTFFRYFLTKEDVALEPARQVEAVFLEVLRQQPAGGTPMQALRESSRQTWQQLREADLLQRHLDAVFLVARTPALALADASRSRTHRDGLISEVMRRLPSAPDADLRAELIVETFAAATRVAQRRWLTKGGPQQADLQDELDRVMRALRGVARDGD